MSTVENYTITCSMCYMQFDLRRSPPILSHRRLKTHDVFRCPQCGYYVAIPRQLEIPA